MKGFKVWLMGCVEGAHVQVLFTVAVEVHGGRAVVAAVAAAHRRPLLEGDLLDKDGLGGGDERGLLLVTVDLLHHRHLSHLGEHNITTMTLVLMIQIIIMVMINFVI